MQNTVVFQYTARGCLFLERIKSSNLLGWRSALITVSMVGLYLFTLHSTSTIGGVYDTEKIEYSSLESAH